MKVLMVFLLGIVVGAGGYWFLNREESQDDLRQVGDEISEGANKVKESVKKAVGDIDADEIKKELAETGTVIREKAEKAGTAIADATADARITAAVKTKFATEPGVSALKINVDTTDGLVTLSGTAKSETEIARAVKVALETEGVRKVVSTIQLTASR